jgi:putative copper export protein
MRLDARSILPLAAALCIAAPLAAQQGAPAASDMLSAVEAPVASPVTAIGPTLAGETVGVRRTAEAGTAPLLLQQRRADSNVTLMIVGGAALLAGAVIGDDAGTIFMVGGAVVGLIGLWRYLN